MHSITSISDFEHWAPAVGGFLQHTLIARCLEQWALITRMKIVFRGFCPTIFLAIDGVLVISPLYLYCMHTSIYPCFLS